MEEIEDEVEITKEEGVLISNDLPIQKITVFEVYVRTLHCVRFCLSTKAASSWSISGICLLQNCMVDSWRKGLGFEMVQHGDWNAWRDRLSVHSDFISIFSNMLYLSPHEVVQNDDQLVFRKPVIGHDLKSIVPIKDVVHNFSNLWLLVLDSFSCTLLISMACLMTKKNCCILGHEKDFRCWEKSILSLLKSFVLQLQSQVSGLTIKKQLMEAACVHLKPVETRRYRCALDSWWRHLHWSLSMGSRSMWCGPTSLLHIWVILYVIWVDKHRTRCVLKLEREDKEHGHQFNSFPGRWGARTRFHELDNSASIDRHAF